MRKPITPKYRIMIDGQCLGTTNSLRIDLEAYVIAYGKSLELGGVNEHISKALGYVPYPSKAWIEDNVPASKIPANYKKWQAATFQV